VQAGRHAVQAVEEGLLVAAVATTAHLDAVLVVVVRDAPNIPASFPRASRRERGRERLADCYV
jgi:hypothetical protein